MGRRSFRNMMAASRDERSSLGDTHVDLALDGLKKTATAAVAVMATYECTREHTLPMLFQDDDLDKLKQVRGMVETHDVKTYQIQDNVTLGIDYDGALVPSIEPTRLFVQRDRVAPLFNYIAAVKAVHDRYEEVKAVLRWLNRNATPGAIRYYWPTAMKLCPQSPIWENLQGVPSRYDTPANIGDWLQSIKDAASTVTGSLMLPHEAKARSRDKMWLTFNTTRVRLSDTAAYNTDQMTYHI